MNLHPRIQALKNMVGGEYLTCRYVDAAGKNSQPDLKLKVDVDTRVIEGYLAVFGVRDSYGTVAVKGCFAKSINDRGPKSSAKNKIIHLYMHDIMEPVGQYTELYEDDYGLRFKCQVDDTGDGTRPDQVLKQTRSGTINQYSFGFDYVWEKMEFDEVRDAVLMFECDLYEGSSVTLKPANTETYTIRTQEDFTKRLAEIGVEAEEVLAGLGKKQQMEIRQLITRYKSLASYKPEQHAPLDLSSKPTQELSVGDYKLNLTQF